MNEELRKIELSLKEKFRHFEIVREILKFEIFELKELLEKKEWNTLDITLAILSNKSVEKNSLNSL